jgi:hypothetical protein
VSAQIKGDGTPVGRAASGKGPRSKSAHRRAVLRGENARAQQRNSTVGWRQAAAGEVQP